MKSVNRRSTLKKILLTGVALPIWATSGSAAMVNELGTPLKYVIGPNRPVYLFSKVLQWVDLQELPDVVQSLGFDGIDITVRKGGHIDPAEVKSKLPQIVEACEKAGLQKPILTTKILKADDEAETILETAGKLGIKHYRMGWYKYDFSSDLTSQLRQYKKSVQQLSLLNKKYEISGNYQNHTGDGVGAAVWDANELIKDTTGHCGIEYDIRHAQVEGAYSWKVNFELVKDHIHVVDIKDFDWSDNVKDTAAKHVPLGKGRVDFTSFFHLLNKNKIYTPVNLHVEHELGGAEKGNRKPTLSEDRILQGITNDLKFLKMTLNDF